MSETFKKIETPLKEVELFYSEIVTADSPEFRAVIREFLWQKLHERGFDNKWQETVLDLKKVPLHFDPFYTSISHSKKGALIGLAKNKRLGVDIESLERVSSSLLNRIAKSEEQSRTLNAEWLFSAKESCWKACEKDWQIPTISQIETSQWTTHSNSWTSFQAEFQGTPLPGQGWVLVISGTCLSFFICP